MPHVMFADGAQTDSLGRNGVMTTTGVSIMALPQAGYVLVEPITSKGDVGRASVSFPVQSAADVCLALMREAMGNMPEQQREAFLEQSRALLESPKTPYPDGTMFRVSEMDDTMPGQVIMVVQEAYPGGTKQYAMEAPLSGEEFACSEGWLSTFCEALPEVSPHKLPADKLVSIQALRSVLHDTALYDGENILVAAETLRAILTFNPHWTRNSFFEFKQGDILINLHAAAPETVFAINPGVLDDIAQTLGMQDRVTSHTVSPAPKAAAASTKAPAARM